jgi:hypothetical protein
MTYKEGKSFPPKLWENFREGNDCVVCGDHIEAGQNGWLYKGRIACPHHSKESVLTAVDEGAELRTEAPITPVVMPLPTQPITDAIDRQTRALEALVLEVRKAVDVGVKVRP